MFVSHYINHNLSRSLYLNLVPILAGEGIHGLLLEALLALRESLVPIVLSDSSSPLVSCSAPQVPLAFHVYPANCDIDCDGEGRLTFRQPWLR